jgi:hypothetical protein
MGPEGMTIEQFRGLCACGFDVKLLDPPLITRKQVLVAEYETLIRESKKGRVCHKDAPETMLMAPADIAAKKREGLRIFAGVGAKRLTDFFDEKKERLLESVKKEVK